ncbi:hypothetical protein [Bradyrhizobium sp.]|jgi:hypothetical protein|uniref:hypothetical protein n=1 Tax=Bradyrhizobium sp. TaxID=376 RepID=UPI00391D500F
MKIFWSWQSDHDGRISHYLVRDALQSAIAKLRVPEDLEEPSEAERRLNLELDHDTKGETGWTDIADSIFRKIDNAAVFVGDVTPVGKSSRKERGKRPRAMMNPNVAIELGYAIKSLTWSRCLGVMNLAYGDIDDLPFDIHRTRSWPVTYTLSENASSEEVADAKKKLAEAFYLKLRPFLAKVRPKAEELFERMPAVRPPAFWFEAGASLGTRRDDVTYTMSAESVLFLRLIPTDPKQRLIPHDLAGQMASAYGSFDDFGNLFILRNDDGAAMCALSDDRGEVENIAQYFNNGEIWAINADIVRIGRRGNNKYLIMPHVEDVFRKKLPTFVAGMLKDGGVKLPITVIGGVAGVRGQMLAWNGVGESGYSKMIRNDVVFERNLNSADQAAIDEYLLGLFETIFEASGKPRPPNFHGFPK